MRILIVFITLYLAVGGAAPAAQTTRVSVASDGSEANGGNWWSTLSHDCLTVAFESAASNLVTGDTNGARDVFIRDRRLGETTMVSVASDGTHGNARSSLPSLSKDGWLVAFHSDANNLVPSDTNGVRDVFVHDRRTGETTRVSVSSSGTQGNMESSSASLSDEGQIVAFLSSADNLVPGDTNLKDDVFVHDRSTGKTSRVSVASNGTQANNRSSYLAMGPGGRFVAFTSSASNLVPLDTNGNEDVFVHDLVTGQTTRVSIASDGSQADGGRSYYPDLSATGRFVAFISEATNFAPNDTNNEDDIFVHDRESGETFRVSVDSNGGEANHQSVDPTISRIGRVVAFRSTADNLVPDDTNVAIDAFAHDWITGETIRLSVASDGTQANLESGPSTWVCNNGGSFGFDSLASNLVEGDMNGSHDAFVREFHLFACDFEWGDTSAWSSTVP